MKKNVEYKMKFKFQIYRKLVLMFLVCLACAFKFADAQPLCVTSVDFTIKYKEVRNDFLLSNDNLKSNYINNLFNKVSVLNHIHYQLWNLIMFDFPMDSLFRKTNYDEYANMRRAYDKGKLIIDTTLLSFHPNFGSIVHSIDSMFSDTLKFHYLIKDHVKNEVFVLSSDIYWRGNNLYLAKRMIHNEYIENYNEQMFEHSLHSIFNCFEFPFGAYDYEDDKVDFNKLVSRHAIIITYRDKFYYFTSSYSNALVAFFRSFGLI